jgi:hypothetical protein
MLKRNRLRQAMSVIDRAEDRSEAQKVGPCRIQAEFRNGAFLVVLEGPWARLMKAYNILEKLQGFRFPGGMPDLKSTKMVVELPANGAMTPELLAKINS